MKTFKNKGIPVKQLCFGIFLKLAHTYKTTNIYSINPHKREYTIARIAFLFLSGHFSVYKKETGP